MLYLKRRQEEDLRNHRLEEPLLQFVVDFGKYSCFSFMRWITIMFDI